MASRISVIVPAYNEESYIKQTLHSLKEQTYQNFETIIVTNGCTDKTEEMVKRKIGPRVKHLSMPVANVSRARNHGASNAQGEVLVFLDADTTLAPNALQLVNQRFIQKNAVATLIGKPDNKKLTYQFLLGLKNTYNRLKLYEGCSGILICRKKDFDQVNGYDHELKVREHRKLTLKLKQLGSYTTINAVATTSMRRFDSWGVGKIISFWTKQWIKDKLSDLKSSEYEKVR